jgi:hypothetical protein
MFDFTQQMVSDLQGRIDLQAVEQDQLISEQLSLSLRLKALEQDMRREADR